MQFWINLPNSKSDLLFVEYWIKSVQSIPQLNSKRFRLKIPFGNWLEIYWKLQTVSCNWQTNSLLWVHLEKSMNILYWTTKLHSTKSIRLLTSMRVNHGYRNGNLLCVCVFLCLCLLNIICGILHAIKTIGAFLSTNTTKWFPTICCY